MFLKKRFGAFMLGAVLVLTAGTGTLWAKAPVVSLGYDGTERTNTPLVVNPAVRSGVLENGMSYFVMKNAEPKNRIQLRLVVKAGSCMEDDDQQGVAHLVEHLAFNGTEHFPKSEIISFIESVGMQFGADLNAYTSFEETVYMLEIPADDKTVLEKAVLILHDWASAVLFEQEELDKERGVVKEEWRIRDSGAEARVNEKVFAVEANGSRFASRLPIGKMDVIENVSRERVVDFYEKWYRPELMSVVAVGDVSADFLEKTVKSIMGQIPASEGVTAVPVYKVPAPAQKTVLTVADAEFPYTCAQIEYLERDYQPLTTAEQLYEAWTFDVAATILNERLSAIGQQADSPWLYTWVGTSGFGPNLERSKLIFAQTKEGRYEDAVSLLFTELTKFLAFGVTDEEFARTKKAFAAELEAFKKGIKKITSADYVEELVDYVVSGAIPVAPAAYYELLKAGLAQVTPEQLLFSMNKYFGTRGDSFFAVTNTGSLPSEARLRELWTKDYEIAAAEAEEELPSRLMERPPKKANVVSKTKLKAVGASEYVLENGVRIIMKKTNFEKDVIHFVASSGGGLSLVPDTDVPSAYDSDSYAWYSGINGFSYTQLSRIYAGSTSGFETGMNRWGEYLSGYGNNADIELPLQQIHLLFTNPQFTDEGWQRLYAEREEQARNFGVSLSDALHAGRKRFLFDEKPYYILFDKEYLSKLDQKKSEALFRERFGNIADFQFAFVGDFNERALLDLCCRYLGTIPGDAEQKEECEFIYYSLPDGVQTNLVRKGTDPLAQVELLFRVNLPPAKDVDEAFVENELRDQMAAVLETRLREVVREDLSGTYGVNVSASCDGYPERQCTVDISFACQPDRVQELKNAVITTIQELQKSGIEQSYTDNVAQIYRRSIEKNLRSNGWWLNRISAVYFDTTEPETVISDIQKKIPQQITSQKFQELLVRYCDTENYFFCYLLPEN